MTYGNENTKRYNSFVAELLNHYADDRKGENVIFSPVSILLLLAIVSDATAGSTSAEVTQYLNQKNEAPEFKKWLIRLQESLSASGKFTSANVVCVNKEIGGSIRQDFVSLLRNSYSGELFSSSNMVSDVNRWVSEKTRGMVGQVADDSMCDMLLFLLNAVAFEDKWLEEYDENDIWEGKFSNADGTKSKVSMLHSYEKYYIENNCFTGFTRPYQNSNFCFMALLPKKAQDWRPLVNSLKDEDITFLYKNRTDQYDVYVSIPEFEASFKDQMTEFFMQLGIHEIFTGHADFSSLSSECLKVDTIIHTAKIEVNRQGTKATAITATNIVSAPPTKDNNERYVNLDRPFLYAIVQEGTGIPVFVGVLNQTGEPEDFPDENTSGGVKKLIEKASAKAGKSLTEARDKTVSATENVMGKFKKQTLNVKDAVGRKAQEAKQGIDSGETVTKPSEGEGKTSKTDNQDKKVKEARKNKHSKDNPKNPSLDEQLKMAVADYNAAYTSINDHGTKLFNVRERCVDLLDNVENLINSIANHPKSFDAKIAEIQVSKKNFKEVCDFTREELDSAKKSAMSIGAGVTGGMAVASLAPSAAMWVATTFGTASTGTAISALSGAAATNAALAWLGGGALAAGGGGMAAGSAFLALAGPVGWSAAGFTLLTSIVLFTNKKLKLNKEKKSEIKSVLTNTEHLKETDAKLDNLLEMTDGIRRGVSEQYTSLMACFGKNFVELDDNLQIHLTTLVNNSKALAILLGEVVDE